MRSFSFILALLFALTATSYAQPGAGHADLEVRKDGNGNGNSTRAMGPDRALKQSCRKMRRLFALSQITANQTKLDAWVAEGKLNTAEVDALKSKAANATAELQTLQSNTTLVAECAVVNAERKSIAQCMRLKQLTKMASLAGNSTALAAFGQKRGLNETQIEKLKAKIADAPTKLQALMSNTTLTTFCTQRRQAKNDGESANNDCTMCVLILMNIQIPPQLRGIAPRRVKARLHSRLRAELPV